MIFDLWRGLIVDLSRLIFDLFQVITISSTAGFVGGTFCTAYAAGKFGVEGWMESLAPEVASFGIRTMLVEPGFFRTELLSNGSTTFAEPVIALLYGAAYAPAPR